jgi:hypothetical protein
MVQRGDLTKTNLLGSNAALYSIEEVEELRRKRLSKPNTIDPETI